MAIKLMPIPVCDMCGGEWLPRKKRERDDPRLLKRCAICKTTAWNKNSRTKNDKTKRESAPAPAEPVENEKESGFCIHRLLHCQTCGT